MGYTLMLLRLYPWTRMNRPEWMKVGGKPVSDAEKAYASWRMNEHLYGQPLR